MKEIKIILVALVICIASNFNQIFACSRVVYQGSNGTIITGRTMDWKGDIPANLWVFPKGMERNGKVGSSSVEWKSKYGSVVTSSWNIAATDGMNEKGLVGNLLWLLESQYPKFEKDSGTKGLAISLWLQYVLDNFATVDEAVKELRKEEFVVVSSYIPGTKIYTALHLSISDNTGDNAIFEYINGELVIHHDTSYVVMTNSPVYEDQLAINNYWKDISGTIMLPGTNRAADRFVRGSFYINALPKTDDTKIAVPAVFSVIRNLSVPFGISTPNQPNISSTQWRTVSDQKNLVYYFENVLNTNIVWLDFANLDFSENGEILKLSLENRESYPGESSKYLVETKPFIPLGLE